MNMKETRVLSDEIAEWENPFSVRAHSLTLIVMRGATFISLSLLDQILPVEF